MSSTRPACPSSAAPESLVRPRFIYLHGFASSPGSRKARFFQESLAAEGIELLVPALDGGAFENLTISGQLRLLENTAGDDELVLIGSSMGGYISALYAARHPQVRRLCLLAPAFGFLGLWQKRLGPEEISRWRRDRVKQVFHYGLNRDAALRFDLLEDAAQYEAQPDFRGRTLIFHGNQDDVVPVDASREYAERRDNVELVRLDAGHELTEVLDVIWQRAKSFLIGGFRRIRMLD